MSTFMGGTLSFKGDKKKKKKKAKKKNENMDESHDDTNVTRKREHDKKTSDDDEELTEAERRSLKFRRMGQERDLEKIASKSHRERIEEFNEKLSNLTEHNDIPRVSAAGNG